MTRLPPILIALGMFLTLGSMSGLTLPARGAAGSVQTRTGPGVAGVRGPYATFAWQGYRGARFYYWQLWMVHATGRGPLVAGAPVVAARVPGTSYAFNTRSLARGTYQWRVVAADAQGTLISAWLPAQTFTVGERAQVPRIGAPVTGLRSVSGALTSAARVTLSWRRYRGASRYYLFLWMAHTAGQHIDGRTQLNHGVQVRGTSYTLTTGAWPRGTYQWRVAAANAQGTLLSSWTRLQSVTLRSPVTRPTVADTPVPPTATRLPPTNTSVPPTATNMSRPTEASTNTPRPTDTPVSPTPTIACGAPTPGTILFSADASNGKLDSMAGTADWKHVNGLLVNDGSGGSGEWGHSWIGTPYTYTVCNTNNYAIEFEAQVTSGSAFFGIGIRRSSHGQYDGGINDGDGNYGGTNNGTARIDAGNYNSPIVAGNYTTDSNWHTYRLEANGNELRFLVDGLQIMQGTDNRYLSGGDSGLFDYGVQMQIRAIRVIALGPTPCPATQPGEVLYEAMQGNGDLDKMGGTADWKHVNGLLVNDGSGGSGEWGRSWIGTPYTVCSTNNYAVEFEAQVTSSKAFFGIVVRRSGSGQYYGGINDGDGNYGGTNNGTARIDAGDYNSPIVAGNYTLDSNWHTYRLEANGNNLRFLVDGVQIMHGTDNRFLSGSDSGLFDYGVQMQIRAIRVYAL